MTIIRNVLIGGGVLAAGAAVAATYSRIAHNKEQQDREAQDAARNTPQSIDDFVSSAIAAYDTATYDPLDVGMPRYGDNVSMMDKARDGVLTIGMEDTLTGKHREISHRTTVYEPQLAPEIVSFNGPRGTQVARALLRAADTNNDSQVTKAELTAAVTPYAGSDGMLDAGERRRVLIDGGLGEPTLERDLRIARGDAVPAGKLVDGILRSVPSAQQLDQLDEGSPAFRISEQATWVANGKVLSAIPFLSSLERTYGNGNGLLSKHELGAWVATELRQPAAPFGYVDAAAAANFGNRIEVEQLGRIDRSTLSGAIYYNTEVSQANIDAHYGGNLTQWMDQHTKIGATKRSLEWKPDPNPTRAAQ